MAQHELCITRGVVGDALPVGELYLSYALLVQARHAFEQAFGHRVYLVTNLKCFCKLLCICTWQALKHWFEAECPAAEVSNLMLKAKLPMPQLPPRTGSEICLRASAGRWSRPPGSAVAACSSVSASATACPTRWDSVHRCR